MVTVNNVAVCIGGLLDGCEREILAMRAGYRERPNAANLPALHNNLHRNGFRVLGFGLFSLVVRHPDLPDVAIKIGLKPEDSGAAYAAWCRANPGIHVPTIYDIRRFKMAYVVVMMRYTYNGDCDYSEEMDWALWNGTFRSLKEAGAPDTLVDVLKSIREFFGGVAQFDLHEENFMYDAHGNVVITDPVSYKETSRLPGCIFEMHTATEVTTATADLDVSSAAQHHAVSAPVALEFDWFAERLDMAKKKIDYDAENAAQRAHRSIRMMRAFADLWRN